MKSILSTKASKELEEQVKKELESNSPDNKIGEKTIAKFIVGCGCGKPVRDGESRENT
jgi:hypothetical protein